MKCRLGFVSNSSSTSYVIVLPDDPKFDIERAWEDSGKNTEYSRDEFESMLRKDLSKLVKDRGLTDFHSLLGVEMSSIALHRYIICTLNVQESSGEIKVVALHVLKQILSRL